MYQKGKYFFWLFITFTCFTPSFSQVNGWELQNCGKDLFLTDVFFLNVDTGWVVGYEGFGEYGLIMNTTDGGANWTTQDSSDTQFMAVEFTDRDHGWAVGYRSSDYYGAIFHTSDGGQSWFFKDSCEKDLNDIFFLNADTGYVVGGGRSRTTILRTTDAGENWNSLDAYGGHMYTVCFINSLVGWAAGERGAVLKTVDGGNNWNTTYMDVGFANITSIHFIDQDNGWMVGGDHIFKTTDGGESWESQVEKSNFNYYYSCYFINSNSGWISGYGNSLSFILYTEDGGESWQVQSSMSNNNYLYSLCFINDTTGWCAGSNGHILKTTSGGIVSVDAIESAQNGNPEQYRLQQNFPNPFNAITTIAYNLPASGHVSLVVYNMQGEEVKILVNGMQSAGKYSLTFDGSGLSGGIYYYKLTDTGGTSVNEMLLIR